MKFPRPISAGIGPLWPQGRIGAGAAFAAFELMSSGGTFLLSPTPGGGRSGVRRFLYGADSGFNAGVTGPVVDFEYLERFVGGDMAVVDEVLAIFREQTEMWTPLLDASRPGWRDAVHTLKGSAGGIGAFRLAELCDAAERAEDALAQPVLDRLLTGVDAALLAVSDYQRRRALQSLKDV